MKSLFKNVGENYSFVDKKMMFGENMGQSSFQILPPGLQHHNKFCMISLISNIFYDGETWRRI